LITAANCVSGLHRQIQGPARVSVCPEVDDIVGNRGVIIVVVVGHADPILARS